MTRRALIALAILATAACTPHQIERWLEWHELDPQVAEWIGRRIVGAAA